MCIHGNHILLCITEAHYLFNITDNHYYFALLKPVPINCLYYWNPLFGQYYFCIIVYHIYFVLLSPLFGHYFCFELFSTIFNLYYWADCLVFMASIIYFVMLSGIIYFVFLSTIFCFVLLEPCYLCLYVMTLVFFKFN